MNLEKEEKSILGQALTWLREKAKKRQEDCADFLGCTTRTWQNYESGNTWMKKAEEQSLLAFLGAHGKFFQLVRGRIPYDEALQDNLPKDSRPDKEDEKGLNTLLSSVDDCWKGHELLQELIAQEGEKLRHLTSALQRFIAASAPRTRESGHS